MKKTKIFLVIPFFLFCSFTNAQTPISDLRCWQDVIAGSIWLAWTVPSNIATSNAYEIRYIQGNTMDWERAIIFSQNWNSGNPGFPKQETITGLNPGTEFTFAIKWKDQNENWSEISNSVSCVSPFAKISDNIAPTSQIENPKTESQFFEGENIKIEGWAKDEGGSSVQKVEISFDGKNWQKTNSIKSENGKLYWEYLWQKVKVGEYQIKTRATDWMGNTETPSEGIKIKVLAKPIEEEKPIEKPITQMTVEELKAKIIEIQLKLIQLISQLIQILQQKLIEIQR